jgi:hypothetical protein
VDLASQHDELKDDLSAAFARVLERGSFTLGDEVDALEAEFAAFVGTREAIGVGSGTDALHLTLRAADIGPGDEVITAVNSFAATAEAIVFAGATPVFVDVDDSTLLMDLDATAAAVTERTKAIIPVHLYGQCVDMPRLTSLRLAVSGSRARQRTGRAAVLASRCGRRCGLSVIRARTRRAWRRRHRHHQRREDRAACPSAPAATARTRTARTSTSASPVGSTVCRQHPARQSPMPPANDQRRFAARATRRFRRNGVVLPTVARRRMSSTCDCVRRQQDDVAAARTAGVQTGIHHQVPLH